MCIYYRSRDEILLIQSLSCSPIKRKKFGAINLPWEPNSGNSRISNTPTPDFTSHCSSSTPLIRSPYAGRRGISDDGDSSVYSVDTDGYYTSMHTDSGLWCNAVNNLKLDDAITDTTGFRQRQESQSSVSTIGNSSINSFLSKSATECSSNSGSLKGNRRPDPPVRSSSSNNNTEGDKVKMISKDADDSEKSYSPHPQNGSTSESDHEVGDRIRVKTTITANRYPSMCAVSPETSDDEASEVKAKLSPHVNVIVAEVHREESCDNRETQKVHTLQSSEHALNNLHIKHTSPINMYRSETPLPSNFSQSIPQSSQPVATSTPRTGISITTFSPDLNEIRNSKKDFSSKFRKADTDLDSEDEILIAECPTSPHSKSDKSLIPLKYAQHITVTPIARSDSPSSNTGTIKRTPSKSYNSSSSTVSSSGQDKPFSIPFNKKDTQPSYISFQAPDSPVSSLNKITSSEKIPPSPTSSLPRTVARVTLDPTGQVVYSSNSLGRINTSSSNKNTTERTYNTLPLCQSHTETRPVTPLKQISSSCKVDSDNFAQKNEKENVKNEEIVSIPQSNVSKSHVPVLTQSPLYVQSHTTSFSKSSPNRHDFTFRPSRGGRFCRSYFPSHLISPSSNSTSGEKQYIKPTYSTAISDYPKNNITMPVKHFTENPAWQQSHPASYSQVPDSYNKYNIHNRPSHRPSNTVPNTVSDNTSYSKHNTPASSNIWPGRLCNVQENNFSAMKPKQQPVVNKPPNIYADTQLKKNTSPTSFVTLRPPDLIPSGESPPSTLDITSPAGAQRRLNQKTLNSDEYKEFSKDSISGSEQKNLKSMSPSELFAIIHSSKKKHNIKTESEISMSPMSSRSVSPALSQTSLSKLQPIETGVLSKRNDSLSLDKTKWCNSMPSNFRKKTVPDKIGPAKPTSMHDFKMLLLQTRTGVNDNNPRPSAAELLKVSPTKNSVSQGNNSKLPVPSPIKSPISHYSPNPSYSPSHGTVPMKRSMRTRSPYLTRYDSAYPPIMEDCSEEIESSHEDSKCLSMNSPLSHSQMYKMPDAVPRSTSVTKATSTWV